MSNESKNSEEGEGEVAENDPLADDDEVESGDMKEDTGDHSDSEDSDIVELVMEKCDMCGDKLETREALVTHLTREHFQAGLYHELLSRGWVEDSDQCPEPGCEARLTGDMITHWASHHGRAQAMVTRCLDGGEVRLREEKSYCHQFVQKWFRVDVNMENTKEASDRIKILLFGPDEPVEEVIDVEDVEEAEEEDCVIVLEDSSDDDIEIIDPCDTDSKAITKKRILDQKVEPILEHVSPNQHHLLEKASLTCIDLQVNQTVQQVHKIEELEGESSTAIIPKQSPSVSNTNVPALESTQFEVAKTATSNNKKKRKAAGGESPHIKHAKQTSSKR